ncbi:hypothetical protein ACJMK2_034986 [Sinanodonta woodiana]|uniref:Uncharacterized protein n=1 Tax=Sinanodonta woodiana TaxID=1069815 RepID=A0ABD3WWU9_SINWO
MATGFGRGGRGAAILHALSQPARKPGESEEREDQGPNATGAAPVQPVVAPVGRGSGLPLGRGSMMGLIQSARSLSITAQEAPAPPSTTAAPGIDQPTLTVAPSFGLGRASVTPGTYMPMGRGLAAMQALLQGAGRAFPLASCGAPQNGQGTGVSEATVSRTPSAMPSPVPIQPQGTETGRSQRSHLDRMACDERRPVVHRVGTDGKQMALSGNYIRIKCHNRGVFQYHVDFSPEIDSKAMRFKMINEHRDIIGYTKAFDGSLLFLPIELPTNPTIFISDRPTDGAKISITVRLVKVLPPDSCVQLYNIIFRRIMSILEMVQVGRYFYNPKTPTSIPQHKLEVWPGYITSVQEHEGGLMLLADASHRVLRKESVLQIMHDIIQRNPQGFSDEVTRTVVGTVVLTRYNNKTYKVDDILWDKNPLQTFTSSTGQEMTFKDYYKKSYNIDIFDENQPLLLHRPKKKQIQGVGKERKSEVICLIPELSFMTGLTDALRADFRVMKDLGTHTRVTPEQRVLVMGKFVDSVTSCQEAKAELDKWGLELDNDTIQIDGRQLPPEKIVFRESSITASPEADWGRDATRQAVITAVHLRNWVVLYTKRDQSKTDDFISQMVKVCPQMGIDAKHPQRFELRDDRTETFVRGLRDCIKPQVQIVVIVCPTSRDDRYNAIKKICCCECPIPSQVIIGKTISQANKLRSVTQKIALQINCKLGGELWALEIPLKNVMIVGIDVYHDAANKRGSVCGFIASTNRECTRWYSRVCIQPPGQELVDGLKLCLTASIRKYHEVNHNLPQKIIVFRDGVGDGQLNIVAGYEVEQLKTCFTNFGEDYNPTMAVVIVQKRINTRIFLKTSREMQNPPPGTVVDHTITRREWYDFFLVSQHVRQGTVSPTHYVVVYDNTGLQPNHIQRLSYKMTHLYYNWPGTVRVPAPCQYAHKLAQLVGQNIHKEPSQELSDRLFFL